MYSYNSKFINFKALKEFLENIIHNVTRCRNLKKKIKKQENATVPKSDKISDSFVNFRAYLVFY